MLNDAIEADHAFEHSIFFVVSCRLQTVTPRQPRESVLYMRVPGLATAVALGMQLLRTR